MQDTGADPSPANPPFSSIRLASNWQTSGKTAHLPSSLCGLCLQNEEDFKTQTLFTATKVKMDPQRAFQQDKGQTMILLNQQRKDQDRK